MKFGTRGVPGSLGSICATTGTLANGFRDTGRFSKLPYLAMKLGDWPNFQELHIYPLSFPGGWNSANLGSGIVVICIWLWGTFVLLILKVMLGSCGALVSKWHVTRKQLTVEKLNLRIGGSCYMYLRFLWPFWVQGNLGAIQCYWLKMTCNLKSACQAIEQSREIWDTVMLVTCTSIWDTFEILLFSVQRHLGSFGVLVSTWSAHPKRSNRRANLSEVYMRCLLPVTGNPRK